MPEMGVSRRTFLKRSAAAVCALAAPQFAFGQEAGLTGYVYGVSTINPKNRSEELSSIVRLNLESGKVTYHPLPEHRLGHSLVPLPDGGFFAVPYGDDTTGCVFLDHDLNIIEVFNAPDGYGFGGHVAVLPGDRQLFGHFNQAGYGKHLRDKDDTGRNFVLDIETRKVIWTGETDIILGHDIAVTKDGAKVLVGDDSTLRRRETEELEADTEDPFSLVNHAPSIVVYSADTFEYEKTIPLRINGSFVHIEVDEEGEVFGAAEQFIANSPVGHAALRDLLGEDDGHMERYVDHMSEDYLDHQLPFPGPLVRVDIETGNVVERKLDPLNQAPFDIKRNEQSGMILNVFTGSNSLSRYNPRKKKWGYFKTDHYGIQRPYGLADIPGTTFMAVNGFKKGIAVIDTLTMSTVATYPTENYGIKHLLYVA